MNDELVKRLRNDWFGYEVSLKAIDAMDEAADRIEQLTAERDRLREAAKHVTGKVLHDIFVQRMGHAYVDDDHTDLTGVNMDGYFNLVQIAEDILAALKGETP